MQITSFGLELRKIGSFDSLYKEVDMVLSKITPLSVAQQTVAHALQKMMRSDQYPDICNIKHCADLCQICIPREHMLVYQNVHCLHWNEMTAEYRQLIVAMILDDFRVVLTHKE
jgi:hypothetical protein